MTSACKLVIGGKKVVTKTTCWCPKGHSLDRLSFSLPSYWFCGKQYLDNNLNTFQIIKKGQINKNYLHYKVSLLYSFVHSFNLNSHIKTHTHPSYLTSTITTNTTLHPINPLQGNPRLVTFTFEWLSCSCCFHVLFHHIFTKYRCQIFGIRGWHRVATDRHLYHW